MIRVLTEVGVSLKTIKDLAEARTLEAILKFLSRQRYTVSDKLHFYQEALSVLNTYVEMLISD